MHFPSSPTTRGLITDQGSTNLVQYVMIDIKNPAKFLLVWINYHIAKTIDQR